MQRKRFRVVKDGEKPLQTKTTNVRSVPPESVAKSPPSRKPAVSSRKRKGPPSEGPEKRKKRSPSTLFDSEDVQIKVVGPSNDVLKKINGACRAESESAEGSPHGRLTPVKEEEDSLKIEDFDQPPQSTSTPVLQTANISLEDEDNSPFLAYEPGFVSPVLYQPNAYAFKGYSHFAHQRVSPVIPGPFMDRDGVPSQHFAGNYEYMPSQPPFVVRRPEDSLVYGYHPYVGPISGPGPRYQTTYPLDGYGYQPYAPQVYPRNPRPTNYREVAYPSSSNTGSYKSSGGEATYPGSNQSQKDGGNDGGGRVFF